MRTMKFLAVPLAVMVITGSLIGCGKTDRQAPEGPARSPKILSGITVAEVRTIDAVKTRQIAGTIRAGSTSQISARIMAQVLAVSVREGDHVRKGDVVIRLDDRDLLARVRKAEGALKQAEAQEGLSRATLDRYKSLLDGRAVTKQEYDTVEAQNRVAAEAVGQARAGVEEARTWLGFSEIHSPVSGWVKRRFVEPGSTSAPGVPLLEIDSDGAFQVELPVDTSLSRLIDMGSEFDILVDAAGYEGRVKVTEVVPTVDPVSRTFLVRADLPSGHSFRSGQYGEARLGIGRTPVTAIPASAIVHRGQIDGVFTVEGQDNRLKFRIVKVGTEAAPGLVEVFSGLASGERIVVAGAEAAEEGAVVRTADDRGAR